MTVVATVSFVGSYDRDESLTRHLDTIDEASAHGAELVVFPEISVQGYPASPDRVTGDAVKDVMLRAEPVPHGPTAHRIIERARERGLLVVFGISERGETGLTYNTAVLAGPQGYIGKYRKVHLAVNERPLWSAGTDWPVFDTSIGRLGLYTCYDRMWPEAARELALRGADCFVVISAWSTWQEAYTFYDRARAAENERWCIASNYAGDFGGTSFVGPSHVVDPFGNIVATTDDGIPGIAYADIDIRGQILEARARVAFGDHLARDRAPKTYEAMRRGNGYWNRNQYRTHAD